MPTSKRLRLVDVGLGGVVGLGLVAALTVTPAGRSMQRAVHGALAEPAPVVVQLPRASVPTQPRPMDVDGVVTQPQPGAAQGLEPVAVQAPNAAAQADPARVAPAVVPDGAGRFTSVRLMVEAPPAIATPEPTTGPAIAPLADVFLYDAEPVDVPQPTVVPTPAPPPADLSSASADASPEVEVQVQVTPAPPPVVDQAPAPLAVVDDEPLTLPVAFEQPDPAPSAVASGTVGSLPAELFPPGWPPAVQDPLPTSVYDSPPDESVAPTMSAPPSTSQRVEPAEQPVPAPRAAVATTASAGVPTTGAGASAAGASATGATAATQPAPATAAPAPSRAAATNPAPAAPAAPNPSPTPVPTRAATTAPATPKPSPTTAAAATPTKATATTAPRR